jgi:hypothetical protein
MHESNTLLARTRTVEFEPMTCHEFKNGIHEEGKTTVILSNGGAAQSGPQGASGAHTHRAQPKVISDMKVELATAQIRQLPGAGVALAGGH